MRRLKDGRDISAQTAAKARYNRKTYDVVRFHVYKGGRDLIALLAEDAGLSQAEYIRHCIIKEAAERGIEVAAELGGGVTLSACGSNSADTQSDTPAPCRTR